MLSSAMLIIVPADVLRLNYPPFERTYEKVLGSLMRESEKVRQYHAPLSTPHLSCVKHRLTSSLPFGFAETSQWRDMVHHRRGLCALVIPSRCRCIVYHDVSFHPFDRPLDSYLILPQQPFLGGHCRFYIWASVGQSHPTASSTHSHPWSPAGPTQVPCGLPRCFYHRCCGCLLLLELVCTCRRWRRPHLGFDERCIRTGRRP